MPLKIDVAMDYQITAGDAVLLTLEAAATEGQTILDSSLTIAQADQRCLSAEQGIGQRVWAHINADILTLQYNAQLEVTRPDTDLLALPHNAMSDLPPEALTALRPSRFCQSDLFTDFVGQRFGDLQGGAKVAAIADWIRTETSYVSGSSDAATTATDTFLSRQGVCRDYAHLMCALSRAALIPARYVSVYGAGVQPPDFHAVTQVWLDGAWHLVDATGMTTPSGVAIISVGRDAADVAFMETSRPATLIAQSVAVSMV